MKIIRGALCSMKIRDNALMKTKKNIDKKNSFDLTSLKILIEDKKTFIMNKEFTNNNLTTWSGWWWLCGSKMC